MHTIEKTIKGERRRRRHHSDEFKASLVAACSQPGVSIASVALANGVNANLVRRWIEQGGQVVPPERSEMAARMLQSQDKTAFVAVQVENSSPPVSDLRIEIKRGGTTVVVTWPSSAIAASAVWLREILR